MFTVGYASAHFMASLPTLKNSLECTVSIWVRSPNVTCGLLSDILWEFHTAVSGSCCLIQTTGSMRGECAEGETARISIQRREAGESHCP